ncbi:MAG: DNA repair protein RecO [Pseudomonadales bacterium]|nr:DNA repair protein RecO [Pseudomonadales bacterium]
MTTSDALEPAYILHTRKYRDTSLIVEFLTRNQGRVSAVARGARGPKSRQRTSWQPFNPLMVSFLGGGELRTVKSAEFLNTAFRLTGERLILGLYLNELLIKLAGKFEAMPLIFNEYQSLLDALASDNEISMAQLRNFELRLLEELGYGVTFDRDALSGQPVDPEKYYIFRVQLGFVMTDAHHPDAVPGSLLLQIERGQLGSAAADQLLKRLVRTTLDFLLHGRPLKSRELYRKLQVADTSVTGDRQL